MSDEPFDKFMKDMEERTRQHRKRQQELFDDEKNTKNRQRDSNNREDWRNRVRWPGR